MLGGHLAFALPGGTGAGEWVGMRGCKSVAQSTPYIRSPKRVVNSMVGQGRGLREGGSGGRGERPPAMTPPPLPETAAAAGPGAGLAARPERITARAVVIGLLLIPVNCWWIAQIEHVRYSDNVSTSALFFNCLTLLLGLIGLNALLRRFLPRQAFSRGETAHDLHHARDLNRPRRARPTPDTLRHHHLGLPQRHPREPLGEGPLPASPATPGDERPDGSGAPVHRQQHPVLVDEPPPLASPPRLVVALCLSAGLHALLPDGDLPQAMGPGASQLPDRGRAAGADRPRRRAVPQLAVLDGLRDRRDDPDRAPMPQHLVGPPDAQHRRLQLHLQGHAALGGRRDPDLLVPLQLRHGLPAAPATGLLGLVLLLARAAGDDPHRHDGATRSSGASRSSSSRAWGPTSGWRRSCSGRLATTSRSSGARPAAPRAARAGEGAVDEGEPLSYPLSPSGAWLPASAA